MEKNKFIKVPVSERLPNRDCVLTVHGIFNFIDNKFRCPHDGTIQENIMYWLEEVPDYSDDMVEMLIEIQDYLLSKGTLKDHCLAEDVEQLIKEATEI